MTIKRSKIMKEMILYYGNNLKKINEFLNVYTYSKIIGELENLDEKRQELLEVYAITNNISNNELEKKDEIESLTFKKMHGPNIVSEMLKKIGYDEDLIKKAVQQIQSNNFEKIVEGEEFSIDGLDLQILLEANFLADAVLGKIDKKNFEHARLNLFRTKSGKDIFEAMFK